MCSIRKLIFTSYLLLSFLYAVNAEYRSNLYLFVYPNFTLPIQFDFSEITDSTYEHHDSSIVQADVFVNLYTFPNFITSPYGVYNYGKVDFYYLSQGWWMDQDSIVIYTAKGDTVIWDSNITAPQTGYKDTIEITAADTVLPKTVFIVKTSEGQHALFVLVAVYTGGLDRKQFYWVIQTDGSGVFQNQTFSKFKEKENLNTSQIGIIQTQNTVIINSLSSKLSYSLYNIKGRNVSRYRNTNSDQIYIDKSNLPQGCYILKVKNDKKHAGCYNIVITK